MKFPVDKNKIMQYGGIAVGYLGGNAIQNSAIGQKITNEKLRAAAVILVGALLSKKGKGAMSNVGTGLAVSGAVKLVSSFLPENVKGMIAGDTDTYMSDIAEQIADTTVLNGSDNFSDIAGASVLNGHDEFGDQAAS